MQLSIGVMRHAKDKPPMRSIATRRLVYKDRRNDQRGELVITIYEPKTVDPDEVSFLVDSNTAECTVEIRGLPEAVSETIYGADDVQALQLASDVDRLLGRVSKNFELFFPSGESYFEGNDNANDSAT